MLQSALQLASQHHRSEYNRTKFGASGSPLIYVPLSTHLPDHFRQLRQKQLALADDQPWWPAPRRRPSIQEELMAAMASSLVQPLPQSIKTSVSHPIKHVLSPFPVPLLTVPQHLLCHPSGAHSPHLVPCLPRPAPRPDPPPHPPAFALHTLASRHVHALHAAITSHTDQPIHLSLSLSLKTIASPLSLNPSFQIGNLYLSSCPGKKVRLDGPVKGRSGVCRDIETDMIRMKHLGVACIVCCLDDEELDFLGAPWPEYEQCARRIGIDVLRLPTPEGLPPISAHHLDSHLLHLINQYTLRGIPILVHCRGGVGRAGIIACCWTIRLGLCGWTDQYTTPTNTQVSASVSPSQQDALSLVQNVIALIRRRRSVKAVETYEQVQFLLDYVQYLSNLPSDPIPSPSL